MSDYATLTVLVAFLFFYSIVAGRLGKTVVSGAIVFAGFGIVCGPYGLNVLELNLWAVGLRTLAEWTLAVVLFTDAADSNFTVLRSIRRLPERLLLIGLPLTIALGFGVGALMLDGLTLIEIGILATMLAPTDAALGQAVVTNPAVPSAVRECLNVESGLNDGICVPVLFIFLALASNTPSEGGTMELAMRLVLEEIGIGVVVGLGVAAVVFIAIRFCATRSWLTEDWIAIPVVAAAMTCFALAQALGGSGFIGSFVGGMTFGVLSREHKQRLLEAAESTGNALSLFTWVVFGVAVVGSLKDEFHWTIALYALLSLTVVRMLPVFLVLGGAGLDTRSKLFIGWFGPRGLASIVFIIIVLEENLPGQHMLAMTVAFTVLSSVIAHGLTAIPLARAYGASMSRVGTG